MSVISNSQLTDLATLKKELKLEASDTAVDTQLSRLIIAVSKTFLELINTPNLILSSLQETFMGNGQCRFFTKLRPVISVVSLYEETTLISPTTTPYQGNGYTFDEYGIRLNGTFYSFKKYTLDYTGGVSTSSDTAYMAEQGVLSLCNLWWKRRGHADQTTQSLGNQITARFSEDELPPETRVIVKVMKRVM